VKLPKHHASKIKQLKQLEIKAKMPILVKTYHHKESSTGPFNLRKLLAQKGLRELIECWTPMSDKNLDLIHQ
jgi:hypothetical protein